MLFLSALLAFCLQITSLVTAADTNAWKSRSIYFVLTDRIARSDGSSTPCSNLGNYCGGTFKGLQSQLDYIQGLGFDSIWITPVVANSAGGYHGYWAQDLYSINSNYGSAQDLKNLVNAAHAKGMYMMIDVVTNHMGQGPIANNLPALLSQQSSYHPTCQIPSQDPSQYQIQECRIANLPDVDTQDPNIRSLYNTWVSWLMNEYSFDGARIDTVKHVEQDFWPPFASAIGAYSIGEVWDGDPAYLAPYAKLMPGLLNYATYYPMNEFYMNGTTPDRLIGMMNTVANTFPDPTALGTFLDNHDNPRWLSMPLANRVNLKNALAFVILSRGIPILYYGTEQGYSGGNDPANREDLWRSGFNQNTDLYQAIKKMTAARKAAGGLAGNDHVHLGSTSNAYAFGRANSNLIVITTNGGGNANFQFCFNSQRPNGRWSDVYGNAGTVTTASDGNLCVTFQNGEPIILLANSGTDGGSPSPTATTLRTTTTRATNTATGTACPTAVSVTFSQRITTVPGDTIKIVGNTTQLGNWNPANAPALSASKYTSSNPVWSITLSMAAKSSVQYKFVKVSSGGTVTWENDPNRAYSVPACQASASSSSVWQ